MSDTPAPITTAPPKSMDAIMALCKRRGFIYQASEIYGGINGFWDYGPLGAQLKKNLRDAWWEDIIMVPCGGAKGPDGEPVSIVPLETCIIQHPKVWEASGHLAGFNDPMCGCKKCQKLFRADHLQVMRTDSDWQKALLAAFPVDEAGFRMASERSVAQWHQNKGRKIWENYTTKPVDWKNLDDGVNPGWMTGSVHNDLAVELLDIFEPFREYPLDEAGQPAAVCPNCGGNLTSARQFSLMFDTITGAVRDDANKVYLRPETAQGIFVQFKNVVDTTRVRVPFGIGNTGKSFRNEVTPRNFTFRSREFEQMELEFFCHADQARDWYAFWKKHRMEWWQQLGLAGENLRLRDHETDELAHYAKAGAGVCDIEYRFPFTAPGFGELEGVAHRGNFDLTQHEKHSRIKMQYFDTTRGELLPNGQRKGEWFTPDCIEPAAGLDRGVLALICEAYTKDESRPSPEFMKFHPRLAPIKAAVFPLVNKDGMPEVADKLHLELFKKFGRIGAIETDAKQSIGKRYARMDEAGCPFCFTIDGDTLTAQTVTCRDRDTGQQHRLAIDKVSGFVSDKLGL